MRMPKVAILSDIHGNLHALKAVLREVATSGAEEIVFGGDLVGYGAAPRECVELVRNLGGHCVLGNHDAYSKLVFDRGEDHLPDGWKSNPVWSGAAHAVREMETEALEWLWSRPWFLRMKGGIVAHASLAEPNDWPYILDDAVAAPNLDILREKDFGVGFFGHTHRQDLFFDEAADEIPEWIESNQILVPHEACCLVTVGSVGQPRDEADLRASWTIWDPEQRTIEFRRTEYDAVKAAKAILDAGLPADSARRLFSLKDIETPA
ncbi:MAG: putative phosphodiesterase [Verrucomicrobiales bacterium]|jgi:predicted phosphodiesterase